MSAIVLATGNAGKLREMQAVLEPLSLSVVPQSNFKMPEVEETGLSFVENALIKARAAANASGHAAIADDSGLEVDALKGQPGIYSARFAGVHGDDEANNRKLLQSLDGLPEDQRGARFVCCMVYMRHAADPVPLIATGLWQGRIIESPRGDNGFGYDPLFWVPEQNCCSAELAPEVKNRISHRAQALRNLIEQISNL